MGKPLIFRVDASASMGTGHLMRCLALGQSWADEGGEVLFLTTCRNEDLLQRLREEHFEVIPLSRAFPDPADLESLKDVLAAHPGAWVVLDGYHFTATYQRQIKERGHRLLVIDDCAHLDHYYADIVLNQNLHAEQMDYPHEPYTRFLCGTRYVLLRREFLAGRDRKRKIPETGRRVLVTMGGSDPENHTLKAIRALRQVEVHDLETVVVIGSSNPHAHTLEAAAGESGGSIRFVRNTQDMAELMAWADLAVSSAGTTVWELMFSGTPALLLILADNQKPVAEEAARWNAGRSAGDVDAVSEDSLAEQICSLLRDAKLRATLSANSRQVTDGRGVRRTIAAMREAEA